jgi:hypothetical protein
MNGPVWFICVLATCKQMMQGGQGSRVQSCFASILPAEEKTTLVPRQTGVRRMNISQQLLQLHTLSPVKERA